MSSLAPELMMRARALQELGFVVTRADAWSFLAVQSKWHWDLAMHLTLIVRVRRIQRATIQDTRQGQLEMKRLSGEADPCRLPRGFQHGRGLVDLLVADAADADAVQYARSTIGKGYGQSVHTSIVPTTGGDPVIGTPIWGRAFWPKIEHAIRVAASGRSTPAPTAGLGLALALTMFYPSLLLMLVFCCGLPHLLFLALVLMEKPPTSALAPPGPPPPTFG